MKKIFTLSLSLIMMFALVGCGGNDTKEETKTKDKGVKEEETLDDIDVNAIFSGESNEIISSLSKAERKKLIEEAKKEGVELKFNKDGSTTITHEDGSTMTQKKDGTWTWSDADGTSGELGGAWPDSELAKMLPKAEFGSIVGHETTEQEIQILLTGGSIDDVKKYVEKVKTKGFNVDVYENDVSYEGVASYSFDAMNSDGYYVSVTMSAEIIGITLSKGGY